MPHAGYRARLPAGPATRSGRRRAVPVRPARPAPRSIPRGRVAPPHPRHWPQLLPGVLPDRLQHRKAGRVAGGFLAQQALVDQGADAVEQRGQARAPADCFGAVHVQPPTNTVRRRNSLCSSAVQQIMAPGDGAAERLLVHRRVDCARRRSASAGRLSRSGQQGWPGGRMRYTSGSSSRRQRQSF